MKKAKNSTIRFALLALQAKMHILLDFLCRGKITIKTIAPKNVHGQAGHGPLLRQDDQGVS